MEVATCGGKGNKPSLLEEKIAAEDKAGLGKCLQSSTLQKRYTAHDETYA